MQPLRTTRDAAPATDAPRRGVMFVLSTAAIVLLLAMAAISIDVSFMQLVRTELRVATDSAAKAGAENLLRTQDPALAKQAVIDMAALNRVNGKPLILTTNDIQVGSSQIQSDGSWNFVADAQPYNSVRVSSQMSDSNANGSVPLFLAGIFGNDSFSPAKTATAANMEQDLYLVIDRSHSMCFDLSGVDWRYPSGTPMSPHPICYPPHPSASRWAALVKSVSTYLQEAGYSSPTPRIGLITWGSDIGTSTAEYYYTKQTAKAVDYDLPFTTNLNDIKTSINGRNAKVMLGGTNMAAGMDAAITKLKAGRQLSRKTMILMTDGQWNSGDNPLNAAQRAKAAGITIHTITFLPGADQTTMVQVAELTGGHHYHADDAAGLEQAFIELARTLPVVLTD